VRPDEDEDDEPAPCASVTNLNERSDSRRNDKEIRERAFAADDIDRQRHDDFGFWTTSRLCYRIPDGAPTTPSLADDCCSGKRFDGLL
jgi:hypothetical protein